MSKRVFPLGRTGGRVKFISTLEQQIWQFEHVHPGTPANNVYVAVELHDVLHDAVLRRAVQTVMRANVMLQMTFVKKDGVIHGKLRRSLAVPLKTLVLDQENGTAAALDIAVTEARTPFDVKKGLLWRVLHLRVATGSWLLLTLHRAIADEKSLELVFQQLIRAYGASNGREEEDRRQRSENALLFHIVQHTWAQQPTPEEHDFWAMELQHFAPPPRLPMATGRMNNGGRGQRLYFPLPEQCAQALELARRQFAVTSFPLLLTALALAISRCTHRQDFAIGIEVSERHSTDVAFDIGPFLLQSLLRVQVSPNEPIRDLVQRLAQQLHNVYFHSRVPMSHLIDLAHVEQPAAFNPLFNVVLGLHEDHLGAIRRHGSVKQVVQVDNDTATAPLTIHIEEYDQLYRLVVRYQTGQIDEQGLVSIIIDFQEALLSVCSADNEFGATWPSELSD